MLTFIIIVKLTENVLYMMVIETCRWSTQVFSKKSIVKSITYQLLACLSPLREEKAGKYYSTFAKDGMESIIKCVQIK